MDNPVLLDKVGQEIQVGVEVVTGIRSKKWGDPMRLGTVMSCDPDKRSVKVKTFTEKHSRSTTLDRKAHEVIIIPTEVLS